MNSGRGRRLSSDLRRGEVGGHGVPQGLCEQSAAQDGGQVLGHQLLLLNAAVVFQGQDHWELRGLGKYRQREGNYYYYLYN